ncbi:hypothetical protein LINGRAHAP2_LOCUS15950 [Linum grandiflorum]
MPNYFTTVATSTAATKVVLPDGKVHEFHEPLTAAELMLEHPQQVVVETTTTAGRGRKKAVPLSADKKLDANKVYLMLPVKRGKPLSLSSEEARRVVLSANMALKASSSSVKFMPVFAKMCTANSTEGHYEGILVKLVTRKKESVEEDEEEEMLLENKLASGPEYLSRQLSGKGWRPSLDTIKEKKIEQQKLQHWLF